MNLKLLNPVYTTCIFTVPERMWRLTESFAQMLPMMLMFELKVIIMQDQTQEIIMVMMHL